MARLINAPHLADQPHEPYSDLFVLALKHGKHGMTEKVKNGSYYVRWWMV